MRAIGKATKVTRESLLGKATEETRESLPICVPINWHKPSKMTNSSSTNVPFGGACCKRMRTKQA